MFNSAKGRKIKVGVSVTKNFEFANKFSKGMNYYVRIESQQQSVAGKGLGLQVFTGKWKGQKIVTNT